MRTVLIAIAIAVVVSSVVACEKQATQAPSSSSTPASAEQVFSLTGPSIMTGGERIARCAERLVVAHYGAKKQEYGDPWKEPDTFFSFASSGRVLTVSLVGGNKSVDGAKTRIEARLPALKAVVVACERQVGAPEGALSEHMRVRYVFADRAKGELKDVVTWEAGRYDLPPDDPAVPADLWIHTIP